ncbi:MAG: hypothetical protein Q4F21_13875 [Lachnospiraceae bacterium]|nr:hypothetical protein [Lachnospiraceae bacterium]
MMYKGQRSDMGYVNGLLGRRPEDPRLRCAFEEAKDANTEGEQVVVYSDSPGGGTVKLLAVDGFDISIFGD